MAKKKRRGEKRDSVTHRTPSQTKRHNNTYGKRPEVKARRAAANRARRKLGLKVGDPRDAHHVRRQSSGGSNSKRNLVAIHKSDNRGWVNGRDKKAAARVRKRQSRRKASSRKKR